LIYVLVIKKRGQELPGFEKNLPKWKQTLENKLNTTLSINVLEDEAAFYSAFNSGDLKKYLIIFTSFIEGEKVFDLIESNLRHSIIFRVKENGVAHAYTPKNQNIQNKNVYPQFSIETLNISVNTIVPTIREKLNERNQLQSISSENADEPSPDLIALLKEGTFDFDGSPDNEEDSDETITDGTIDEYPENDEIVDDEVDVNDEEGEEIDTQNQKQLVQQSFSKEQPSQESTIADCENERHGKENEFEDTLIYERTRTIQKRLFAKQSWNNHKTIGVWSPLHNIGVTTFVINYSLFLAENRIYTVVLEGLTKEATLKHWLKRYTPVPKNWVSYAKTIYSEAVDPKRADWSYRDVLFLPLDDDDCTLKWNSEKLELYMKTPSMMDVTLVDMPTGEMAPYTLDSLFYLDELWVIVDDTFQEHLAWKEYIHLLQKKFNIEVKMIFNNSYEFSQTKRLAEEMELDLIATLPSLHKEVMRNYYETVPIFLIQDVRGKLYEDFKNLTQHLFGEDVEISVAREIQHSEPTNSSIWIKFRRWLKGEIGT